MLGPPAPQNVAVFGNRAFKEVSEVQWGWALVTRDCVLTRGSQDADTHRGTTTGGHRGDAVCTPRREASGGTGRPPRLELGLRPPGGVYSSGRSKLPRAPSSADTQDGTKQSVQRPAAPWHGRLPSGWALGRPHAPHAPASPWAASHPPGGSFRISFRSQVADAT